MAGTVLILDEYEVTRVLLQDLLTFSGLKTIVAATGDEAVALFKEHKQTTRVLLLAIETLNREYIKSFHALRTIDPQCTVLILTTQDLNDVKLHFVGEQKVHFLQRPSTSRMLLATVAEALNQAN